MEFPIQDNFSLIFSSYEKFHSFFSTFPKLPTKYSWIDEDYQHHRDQTIDEEVEVSQINLKPIFVQTVIWIYNFLSFLKFYLDINGVQTKRCRDNFLNLNMFYYLIILVFNLKEEKLKGVLYLTIWKPTICDWLDEACATLMRWEKFWSSAVKFILDLSCTNVFIKLLLFVLEDLTLICCKSLQSDQSQNNIEAKPRVPRTLASCREKRRQQWL